MKKSLYLFLGGLLFGISILGCSTSLSDKSKLVASTENSTSRSNTTSRSATFILVRHAEKEQGVKNPNLTEKGTARAKELARTLEHISLDGIFSSNYNRTLATARPIAATNNLETNVYNPSNLSDFKEQLLSEYPNSTVLIVGHSNTTPDLINLLMGENRLAHLGEKEYDDLFVVTILENEKPTLLRMTYGEE